jgi:hypothetical protein
MNNRNILKIFLDPWVILGAIGVGAILFLTAVGLLLVTRNLPMPTGVPTAVIMIVAVPTASPVPTSTQPSLEEPTALPQPSPQPGDIYLQALVQITGTGGDGLRLRTEPGLESEILFLGNEAEFFRVQEGPLEADDFTWWFLVSPENGDRNGWAVAEYLIVVQTP